MGQEDGTAAAGEGWQPRAASRVEEGPPSVWVWPFLCAALWGIGVFLLLLGLASIDYAATHDVPVEHVRITGQYLTGQRISCGRDFFNSADEQATDFVVDRPRSGLPATFTLRGCSMEERPGDVVPVARTGPGPDDVYIHPIEGLGQLLALSGAYGAAIGAVVFVGSAVYARGARWFNRRRKPRNGGA